MTISVYSHKNRAYKPLIKKCIAELLIFFKEVEKILDSKEFWRLYRLSPALEIFGDSMTKVVNRGEAENGVNFCLTEQSLKNLWKGILKIPPHTFTITKDEIKIIYKTLKILKEMKVRDKSNGGNSYDGIAAKDLQQQMIEQDSLHFLFIGEHREISSNVLDCSSSFSTSDFDDSIAGTSLPSVFFEKSSSKVIKSGTDNVETEEGFNIYTQLNFSYVIIPVTPFADNLIRAYKVNFIKMDTPLIINGKTQKFKYQIPGIFNDKFKSFYQIICSLIIQYYLSFGGLEAIKVCDVCGSIFLEMKTGAGLYCSDKCRRIIWADNNKETEEKSQCRNRQNVWLSRNTDLGQRREYKDFCEKCDFTVFPKGGKCLIFLKKYEKDVEEYKITKRGEKQAHKKSVGSGTNIVQTIKMPKIS